MRVLVKINGVNSVHEILEFEKQEDGTVLLTTPEDVLDLIITDMGQVKYDEFCVRLLEHGNANLALFTTVYDEVFEDEEDEEEIYTATCPVCSGVFEFNMAQHRALGEVVCDACGTTLSFNPEDYSGMIEFTVAEENDECNVDVFEAVCPQCEASINISPEDIENGSIVCPCCKALLAVDATETENENFEEEDDEE